MSNKLNFRIIVIDDNQEIHHDFIKILTQGSQSKFHQLTLELFDEKIEENILPEFTIDTASQGKEGLNQIKKALEEGSPYALAFVDISMPPGWSGIETIKNIWQLDKDIQMVICTAYSDYSWETTLSQIGPTDNLLILRKPFDNIAVRQLACALTKKWQLIQDARKYTDSLKKQVENRTLSLQNSLSLMKASLESSSDGILVINNEGNILDYNEKLLPILQVPFSIKNEKKFLTYLKEQLLNGYSFFEKIKNSPEKVNEVSIDIMKFRDGRILECYSQPHILNAKIIGRVLAFRDITRRAKVEEELQYQATHDSLTGLPNRVILIDRIRKAIQQSEMNKSHFAILFIDLDRFKLINDSLGHAAGDELLHTVAARLQSVLHIDDTLTRLGGDEFVVIFSGFVNKEGIVTKLNSLLTILQRPMKIGNRDVVITASIGVSIYPNDGNTSDSLLRNADATTYRAKKFGGNNFQFYSSEMNAESLARLDQEAQLRQAITNKEFFLMYQPQLDLTTRKIVAVEALVRWKHPTKGVLLPMDFIPLAEETGLIVPLGEWVLRTACQQNKAWQSAGFSPIRVAINVTAQQFRLQNQIELVKRVLQETQLKPEYLELELTENVIVSHVDIVNAVTELKKLGITIAIDDFGTGYSSLSYLQKIPLDRLKIDSSFIQHIKSTQDDEVIIRAVIAMAKSLNLEVLAEGVETQSQMEFLKKHECGDVQGFYFSKPLSTEELENYFKNPTSAVS